MSEDSRILAIDTSSDRLILGLQFSEDRMVSSDDVSDKSHGMFILKKVGELLESAGIDKRDLQAIVVSLGPGSFTGLRIGLSAAKGMAVALDIPVVGIDLFEMAAHKLSDYRLPVKVVIPFKRDEYLVGLANDPDATSGDIRVVSEAELPNVIGNDPVGAYGVSLAVQFPSVQFEDVSDRITYTASDFIVLGRITLLERGADDLTQLEPLYVQKSQAEINFDRRNR